MSTWAAAYIIGVIVAELLILTALFGPRDVNTVAWIGAILVSTLMFTMVTVARETLGFGQMFFGDGLEGVDTYAVTKDGGSTAAQWATILLAVAGFLSRRRETAEYQDQSSEDAETVPYVRKPRLTADRS